jgi:hypothetical protein
LAHSSVEVQHYAMNPFQNFAETQWEREVSPAILSALQLPSPQDSNNVSSAAESAQLPIVF